MKLNNVLITLKENQSVIVNKSDLNDPEVLVQGLGRYKLSQLKNNIKKKLHDLQTRSQRAEDLYDWQSIESMITNDALRMMISTVVAAEQELQQDET